MNRIEDMVFFDLETSGLEPGIHEVIQVAAVHVPSFDALNLHIQFNKKNASEKALEMNHYQDKIWDRFAVSQEDGFRQFNQFLFDHGSVKKNTKDGREYKVSVVAGHNISGFDMLFLKEWSKRFGEFLYCDYRCMDTLQLALWNLEAEEYSLPALCKKMKVRTSSDNFHDALNDVRANIVLAAKILRKINPEIPWIRTALRFDKKGYIGLQN